MKTKKKRNECQRKIHKHTRTTENIQKSTNPSLSMSLSLSAAAAGLVKEEEENFPKNSKKKNSKKKKNELGHDREFTCYILGDD